MTTLAYSYVRFSTRTQSKGGSLERQVEKAEAYAAKHGMTLDTELNMHDLGKSGFSGVNISAGALGGFIKYMQDGKVPDGSFLLIEDLDRLSRLPVMEAFAVFQTIINGGVTIVVLNDNGKRYSKGSLNEDWVALFPLIVSMGRANEESDRKSGLLSDAWQKKKKAAVDHLTPMGNNAPMWLSYSQDGGYAVIEERAAVVRRIFQMSINGRGRSVIAATLNKEGTPSFKGKTWGTTSVNRILENRAVLGEYQPRAGVGKLRKPVGPAVPGYFPVIVDEATFNQSASATTSRFINRAKRQTANFNVWSGVAHCADCGSTMTVVKKGVRWTEAKVVKPQLVYLVCTHNRKGVCKGKPVRLDASEAVYREILAKVGDKSLAEAESAAVSKQLQAKQGQLTSEQAKHAETLTIFEDMPSRAVGTVLAKQQAAIDTLESDIDSLKLALASDTIRDKSAFFAALDLVTFEGRAQANALLKRLKITVSIDGLNRQYGVDQDGERILDIVDSSDRGIMFYPASRDTRGTVQQQEGTFTPALRYDADYEEDDFVNEGYDSADGPLPAH